MPSKANVQAVAIRGSGPSDKLTAPDSTLPLSLAEFIYQADASARSTLLPAMRPLSELKPSLPRPEEPQAALQAATSQNPA